MRLPDVRISDARCIVLFAFGFFADPAAAADQRTTDMWLSQAGFTMMPADTPAHVKAMMAMPRDKLIGRTAKNGKRYYLYADPVECKCVFVGDEMAKVNFRSIESAPAPVVDNVPAGGVNVENQIVGDMEAETDDEYTDTGLFGLPF